jgi:hypothetical protein
MFYDIRLLINMGMRFVSKIRGIGDAKTFNIFFDLNTSILIIRLTGISLTNNNTNTLGN